MKTTTKKHFFIWLPISLFIGTMAGISSFIFLKSLDWIGQFRTQNAYIIYALPLVGLLIGYAYYKAEPSIQKGNNAIIEEINFPTKTISWKIAPTIFISTLLSHLVGGSVGREGTAVQLSVGLSDFIHNYIGDINRKILLLAAVAAGFSAVFGTPLAGIVFSVEFWRYRKIYLNGLVPISLAAFVANYVCIFLGARHSQYLVKLYPSYSAIIYVIVAGLAFGLAARLFIEMGQFISSQFNKYVNFSPFKPAIGGAIILLLYLLFDLKKYQGLGLESIHHAFDTQNNLEVFFIKLCLTTFTLACGFKGGEVTPLFFIGATLGSALAFFLPLPFSFLAALGFVSVFAGATNTPIASSILAYEIFGIEKLGFFILSCGIAYLASSKKSIYSAQIL